MLEFVKAGDLRIENDRNPQFSDQFQRDCCTAREDTHKLSRGQEMQRSIQPPATLGRCSYNLQGAQGNMLDTDWIGILVLLGRVDPAQHAGPFVP